MNIDVNENNIPLQKIEAEFLDEKNIQLYVLREDLIHPEISGNKWRKLKYNVIEAKERGFKTLLTFGGAFSNHIAATAAAGVVFGIKTIGIIRGEEKLPLNPTLQLAKDNGMYLKYVSREVYRDKMEASFIVRLKEEFGNVYVVPEGGSNALAVRGCTEIVTNINVDFDVICCACGTGGTIAGVIASLGNNKQVLGFPALKGGSFLRKDIDLLLSDYELRHDIKVKNTSWVLITDYHFGGYAKIKPELVDFVKDFKNQNNIELDLIYTGKMLFGLYDMIQTSDQFDYKTIVVIHTGGVQGNLGFKDRFGVII